MRLEVLPATLVTVAAALALASPVNATLPITKSRPFQAVCEGQGGSFSMSVDFKDLYCDKRGGLYTAFTPTQLAVQRTLCEHVYGAFFNLNGTIGPNGVTGTHTFCATSA
jgi:hypothetical protein